MVKGGGVGRVRFAILKIFTYSVDSGYEEGYVEDVQAASAFCKAIGCSHYTLLSLSICLRLQVM